MTKKSRTILFLICVFLFLLACPLTVMYSQGYRVSFDKEQGGIKVSKTGGLFVKAYPKQVEVRIEEANASKKTIDKRTDFLFGSLLVENLFPKKYNVEIKREGYLPWQKSLEVREKEVTGIKNIILFPKDKELSLVASDLKNIWFFPDHKKIVFQEEDKDGWALKSYDLANNVKSHLVDDSDLSNKKSDLIKLTFPVDLKAIDLKASTSGEAKYFQIDLEKNPPALIKLKSPVLATGTELATEKFNSDSYYLDKAGSLFKNKEKLSDKPLEIKKGAQYLLKISSDFIFLKEDKTLYKFNTESKSFEKFAENINDVKVSPGSRALAYLSDYELMVFFLKDKESEPAKKAGEKLSLIRISEKINDFYWLNEDYLLFSAGNLIKTIEIDDRDRIQSWDLLTMPEPQIFFNDFDKKIYVFSENKLYCSDVFIP